MNYLKMLLIACAVFGFAQPSYAEDGHENIKKCVALTFDDGPDRVLTPLLLSILRDANVKATFYLVGVRVSRWPEIVREMQNDGHEIGNHSWSHPNLAKLSPKNIEMQIEQTDRILIEITGAAPRTIRPPYGAIHSWMRQMLHRPLVLWDVDTRDWHRRSSEQIAETVRSNVHAGSVVLMHDIHQATVSAVPTIITELKAAGYMFVTVSELLQGQSPFCIARATR